MSEKEKEVFSQKLDMDDLDAVAGGFGDDSIYRDREKKWNCYGYHWRNIYEGGFPNCGSTVGDGSMCSSLDGCTWDEIFYGYMQDCYRAWE